jgi:hypothetical protein
MKLENGLLLAEPGDPVRILHLQTARGGLRKTTPISMIVLHITGGHPKPEPVRYLVAAELPASERERLRREVGKGPMPPALVSTLANEGRRDEEGKPHQASWDFTVGYEGGEIVDVVQYNCDLAGFYTWHGGPSKKFYSTKRAGKVVAR